MNQINYLLFYDNHATIGFNDFSNGIHKWTVKSITNTLNRYNQDTYNISFNKSIIKKIQEMANKTNYELTIKGCSGVFIDAELLKRVEE